MMTVQMTHSLKRNFMLTIYFLLPPSDQNSVISSFKWILQRFFYFFYLMINSKFISKLKEDWETVEENYQHLGVTD